MGSKKKKQTIGYKYFMGLHMGLCRGPIDSLRQIRVGGKEVWTGNATANTTVQIYRPNVFGGDEQEGGIQGPLDVMMGAPDQPRNNRLASMLGGLVSAFRGVTSVFFDGLVCAMSPYPKEWEFLVQKTKKGWHEDECWYPEKCHMLTGTLDITRNARVYLALDVSRDMSDLYITALKSAAKQVIDQLAAKSVTVRVRIVAFASTRTSIERVAATGAADLKAFIDGLPAVGSGLHLLSQGFADVPAFFTVSDDINVAVYISPGDWRDFFEGKDTAFVVPWVERTSNPPIEVRGIGFAGTRGRLDEIDNSGGVVPIIYGADVSGAVTAIMNAINSASLQVWAMNSAHILRRLYTDPIIGRGLPADRLDEASWRATADTLYNEGFGLCMKWARTGSVEDFAAEVINHCGAVTYTSRRTGKIVLKLIRDDYGVGGLPLYTPDTGLLGFDDDQSAAQTTGVNEIVVKYVDVAQKKDSAVREKNLGAIMAAGGVTVSEEVSYLGLPTEALARRVARRDLQAKSGYIKRFTVRLDRRGADIMPGGVFRISDSLRGIDSMVLRAGRVEYGTGTDGEITITALQDVFGLPETVYREPEESGYKPPDTSIKPPVDATLFELPYRELVQVMTAAELDVMAPGAGYLHAAARQPTTLSQSFDVLTRVPPADYTEGAAQALFCPGGRLQAGVDTQETAIVLTGATGLDDVNWGTTALIGGEVVRIDGVDVGTSTLTIARGCLDTIPATHAAGTPVLCYDGWGADVTTEYTASVTVNAKLLTNVGDGQMTEDQAPELACTFADRAARPYPPADVTINSVRVAPAKLAGSVAIAWVHRNRVTQSDNVVGFREPGIAPEDGTTYTVRLVDRADDTLLAEYTGLTGASKTLPAEDFGDGSAAHVRVTVTAWRDGLACWQSPFFDFEHGDGAGGDPGGGDDDDEPDYGDGLLHLTFGSGYTPDDGDAMVLDFKE